MSNHTPGPWQTGPYDPTYIFGPDGDEICWTGVRHHSEAIPNARLICAAPDLLEALEPFASMADVVPEGAVLNYGGYYITWTQFQKAAAAVREANGKDNNGS